MIAKYTLKKSLYVLVAALAVGLLTTNPVAAQVTFNLTNVGPTAANLAGVYTSPYTGNINGGSNIPVICDDFADESYVPESWMAFVTSGSTISSLTPGTLSDPLNWVNTGSLTVDGYTLTQTQAYEVAAVLAVDILQNSGPSQQSAQEDYSFAMWGLFDPCGSGTFSGTGTGCTTQGSPADLGAFGQLAAKGDTTDLSNATTDLKNAISYIFNNATKAQAQADLNDITVYSYDAIASGGAPTGACGGPCPKPQEFITVNMAEPSAPALLGIDLLGLAGLILIARRRGWLAR